MDARVIAKGGSKGFQRTQARSSNPDNDPGQKASDNNYRKDKPPEEKPSSSFLTHGGEHFSINDGIINTAYDFEEAEAEDGENDRKYGHGSIFSH